MILTIWEYQRQEITLKMAWKFLLKKKNENMLLYITVPIQFK